jgi:hypothetical protein
MAWSKYFLEGLQTGASLGLKKKEMQAEAEKWKQQQDIELVKANLIPNPEGDVNIGGQRYIRKPPMMPDFSGLGNSGGMGITGGTIDPISGDVKYTFGELPANKDRREQMQDLGKNIAKEESDYSSSKALLDSIKKDWLATNPTRITNKKGKLTPMGVAKGVLQPAYTAEQWTGAKFQITENQRADRAYIRRINSLQSRLAKGVIGKDVGNLNYQEQIAAKGGVAGLGDTYEVGIEMFNKTENMLKEMLEARKAGFANVTEKWTSEGRVLTPEKAKEYLEKAGGDSNKARYLATMDKWAF